MAEETQYTANTGVQPISVANSYLDGTNGTYSAAIITGASNGTIIKSITIKAIGDTSQGMVRLFIYDGSNNKLVSEIEIPAVTKSSTDPAFEITIPVDFALKSGWSLKASTELGNTFNIIAEGMDWAYYGSVRPESSKYTANTGYNTITAANASLTGSGIDTQTIWDIITAASNGTQIQSVTIKSQISTTDGMIRLFVNDGAGDGTTHNFLLTEIPVTATTKSGTAHSFSARIDFGGKGFFLRSGWKLRATTEKTETFNVVAEGLNLTYPA